MASILNLYKKVTPLQWAFIFGIWSMAAVSFATQFYFSALYKFPNVSWLKLFLQQIPSWYLCALFTPVVMGIYEAYPLDTSEWKTNLFRHISVALSALLVFSNLRLLSLQWSFNPSFFTNLDSRIYFSNLISQIPWDATIYILIAIVVFANKVNTVKKSRELYATQVDLHNQELQNQLNLAQLETLKLQLSPHFLFNTLNTVGALIRTKEYETAIHVNTRLGDFLRKTLATENQPFVSLEEEMAFVDLYLDIESVRFKDRLVVRKDISAATLSKAVPHLILQPLIENAIKHGLAKYRNAKLVEIRAVLEGNYLVIQIYNDGAVLPEHWQIEENERIGWRNVRQRLEKLYADTASLHLQNDPIRNGVVVTLRIPCL